MLAHLHHVVEGLPTAVQVLSMLLVSCVPFLEGNWGAALGVLVGMPWFLAIPMAVAGTMMVSFFSTRAGAAAHRRYEQRHHHGPGPEHPRRPRSRSHQRATALFHRFGPIGALLLGQILLSGILTAGVLTGLGVPRRKVLVCHALAVTLWACVLGGSVETGVLLVA